MVTQAVDAAALMPKLVFAAGDISLFGVGVCGTETWAMKKANLQSLESMERMMVRWMCWVSLKDRKRSVDLYSLLGVECGGCGEAWQTEVVLASGA